MINKLFKLEITMLAILAIFYFLTRLINLDLIPIFTDEAIYAYWAQVALHDPANRFISLEDGKQPLFIWFAAISHKFVADPLIANRLISVLAGFGSLLAIYFLAKELFSKNTARIAALLYIILPFTLLYDKMGLFDSLLTMLGISSIFFSIKLIKDPRLDWALLAGISIGLAMITKSSGVFFLYYLPLSLILFNFKDKNRQTKFFKWLGFVLITGFISQIIYNSLRLSPLFYIIGRKNLEFIRSINEVVKDPFIFFTPNTIAMLDWLTEYLGWPLFIVLIAAAILPIANKNKTAVYLTLLVVFPFAAKVIFNKVLYPRFLLFYFPFVIILIAYFLSTLADRFPKATKFSKVLLILVLISPAYNSWMLLTKPLDAKIPKSDANQYLNDWPAGFGVKEITKLINNEPSDKEVYVATEGTFGLLPYALQIYFFNQKNVHILGFWPVDPDNIPAQVLEVAQNNKTYFVFNENQKEIKNPRLKFIARYQKGRGDSFMRLYEVIPQ